MKNYYDILEVNENASKEVIERVYKVLAKKYHPDVNPDNPSEAEAKFKEITEAYEVLSDDTKRRGYDELLKKYKTDQLLKTIKANQSSSSQQAYPQQGQTQFVNYEAINNARAQREQIEREVKKAYNEAYIKALRRAGIRVVEKKTFKEQIQTIKNLLLLILITIIVCFVVWHIPPARESILEWYNNSGIFKNIIDGIFNKS